MSLQHTLNQAVNNRGVTAEIYYDDGPEVSIKITGNAGYGAQAGWRVRGRASDGDNTYYVEGDQYTTSGSFEAIDGKTYMFQAVWGSASNGVGFTVNFNSSDGDSSAYYLITLDDGGYAWDNFPQVTLVEKYKGQALILPQLQKEPTLLPKVNFKITGNANGGVENTYINASKQSTKTYNFTGWTDDLGNKWYDSFTDNRHADLIAGQEEIETIEYFNNTLASLPKPTKDNDIIKYNIFYDAKGGIASKTEETIEQNIQYYFDYWSSDKSGNGERYTDSSSFTKKTEVFAIWKKQQDITPSVVLPTATKDGYKFFGWATEDQTPLLPAGAVVNINKDMSFHAVWESDGRIFIHNGTTWVAII